MINLLISEFSRLFKSTVFKILAIISALGGFYIELIVFISSKSGDEPMTVDTGIFAFVYFSGAVMAILISLFTGTEYSEGTLRNKLIMGYSRTAVYLSKLIVNSAAGLMMFALYLTVAFATGLPMNKTFKYSARDFLFSLAICCLIIIAYSSIYTLTAMIWKNKAGNAVLSLILFLALVITARTLFGKLNVPEFIEELSYVDESGNINTEPAQKNNLYLSGTKRKVVEFVYDFIPTGQSEQISGMYLDPVAKGQFIPYSLIIMLTATASGIIIFKKKDIN